MTQPKNRKGGIYLQQYKEPALSRDIRQFINTSSAEAKVENPVDKPVDQLEPWEIIRLAKEAAIVDERDGRPLYQKLQRALEKGVQTIVVDAMDDEPYVSSQLGPLLNFREDAVRGLRAAIIASGAQNGLFTVYRNITETNTRIPGAIEGIRVARVGKKYPAEHHVGRELGIKHAYIKLGVCSLIFLSRAITTGQVQRTTFVTVAGNCIANPTNLEVSLGIALSHVLERCGLADNPTRVIIGGSMTGISVIDTDKTVVSPTTRAVLAFREDEKERNYSCIGCGRCIGSCPQGLDPMTIYKAIGLRRLSLLGGLGVEHCINCGICSYVCPSKLPLTQTIAKYCKPVEEDDLCN